jgi:hypothetical protein
MLTFRGARFQYFLSVSLQEDLGRGDLNRWILEAKKAMGFMPVDARPTGDPEGFGAVAQGLFSASQNRFPHIAKGARTSRMTSHLIAGPFGQTHILPLVQLRGSLQQELAKAAGSAF